MRHKLWISAGIFSGLILGFAVSTQAHAQKSGGSPAAAPPSNTSQGPQSSSGFGKNADYSTLQENGGTVLNGSVKVEDAETPWDPIPVVVNCKGVVRYRTQADGHGHFTIQGSTAQSEITPEKSNPRPETTSQLVGCDVEADLPGFTSSTVTILDNPNIGIIRLHPNSAASGSSTSATTASVSKDGMKHFNNARSEWINHNGKNAERELQKAVKSDPNFAEAWYELGRFQQSKDPQAALNSYQKAAAADSKFISPYEPIAELSAGQKKWQDVVNATTAALKLDPAGTPQILYLDAVGKFNLGQVDDAEASARKSLAMDPQHVSPNTEQLLAVMLAGQGDLQGALQHLQNSLTYIKSGPNLDIIKQQIAQLQRAMPQDSSK